MNVAGSAQNMMQLTAININHSRDTWRSTRLVARLYLLLLLISPLVIFPLLVVHTGECGGRPNMLLSWTILMVPSLLCTCLFGWWISTRRNKLGLARAFLNLPALYLGLYTIMSFSGN